MSIKKMIKSALRHKMIAGFIILALLGSGYGVYRAVGGRGSEVRYLLAAVDRGSIISSVSGSGQVSIEDQIDLKSKVSGDVVYVGAQSGKEVSAGQVILQIDARDAERAVRDAEANLESAKISFEKLKIEKSETKIKENLEKAYDDGFNAAANAFLDLPGAASGLEDILLTNSITGSGEWNVDYFAAVLKNSAEVLAIRDDAEAKYREARRLYDRAFLEYKSTSRFSEKSDIEKMIDRTYETTKVVAEAVKSASNFIRYYQDKIADYNLKPTSLSYTYLSNLNTYTGQTNNHLLSILSIKEKIRDEKEAFLNADLDLQSGALSLRQKENALLDAREKLADYFIRAPFAGVAAKIDVKKGDSVSANALIATLITKQAVAEISLNEVDVAEVKIGQKATLTFDAVPDLNVSGEVVEIDALGTISQGVVSYMAKITFAAQDERVKPAMSVSADIVIKTKTAVLRVPNAAVKTVGNKSFVEVVEGGPANLRAVELKKPPRRREVALGMWNEEFTEIVSGLKEGEVVVMGTISLEGTGGNQTQQSSGIRFPGLSGGGGFRR